MIWLDIIEDGAWEDAADEWALLGWDDNDRRRKAVT